MNWNSFIQIEIFELCQLHYNEREYAVYVQYRAVHKHS